jgi:tetratricopeptide (TPR) repeat protein
MSPIDRLLERGLADHRAGRLSQAEAAYRELLALAPGHADGLHLLGLVAYQMGRHDAALDFIRQAIARDGGKASYHADLGAVLCDLGRHDEAAASLRVALRLRPGLAEAHNSLGVALREMGRLDEAAQCFREAARLRPGYVQAHGNLGHIMLRLGDHAAAAASFEAALRCRADRAEDHHGLGVALHALGRPAEAEACYREALRLRADFADAHCNLGTALCDLGRPAEAAACCREALRLRPHYPEAYLALGNALAATGQPAEAEASYRAALRLRPDYADAHGNRGTVLMKLQRAAEAAASYRAALRLQPKSATYHYGLGYALLLAGQFAEGWQEYEWRWEMKPQRLSAREFAQPAWRGEPVADRVVLLYAEQGLGDTLQFCRYVPLLAANARTVLEVQAPLVRLLARLPGPVEVVARGEQLPHFDLHCPLLSLPRVFGTTLDTIPAAVPYLTADPALVAGWRERLARLERLRVGLVWAGGRSAPESEYAAMDRRRSIALAALAPLGEASGVSIVSLQKGEPAAQAAHPPAGMVLHDFTADLHDFADTAALVDCLDLVISVDTSVAHLAAAMGKPVWLLNRFDTDWRWLLDREDSPWYSRLRQFRQPTLGDWKSVIRRVADALRKLAAGDRDQLRPRRGALALRGPKSPAGDRPPRGRKQDRAALLPAAKAAHRRPSARDPGGAEALHRLGVVAHQAGRPAEAAAHYREALRLRPDLAEAHCNLGAALREIGRPAEAAESCRAALRLSPHFAEAHCNLAGALCDLGSHAEAEAPCREALRLRADFPEAHLNLGAALAGLGRLAEAELSYRAALRLRPDFADAHANLGNVLIALGRPAEAAASYRAALRLRPDVAHHHHGLGFALYALGRPAEAEASYREAVRLQPGFPEHHFGLSNVLLATGRFAEGWEEHEWRWKTKQQLPGMRNFSAPLWRGEPIADRVILLHAEQGFGDTLQFCRYAPLVAAGAKVVLEVQPALVRLLSGLPGTIAVVAQGDPLPSFDLHCPLLSLPRLFRTTFATIPAEIPYLVADQALAADWRRRLTGLSGLRVGLAWAGGQSAQQSDYSAMDRRRSIALEALGPLSQVAGVSFVSLQKGEPAAQAAHPPPGMVLHDFTEELTDFADTAALIAALDLVIGVDTAVVHLAGTLGRPVWLLNRFDTDWRWLLGRDDSPWYPTLRQFRQPSFGDWASAIGDAAAALRRFVKAEA